MAERSKNTIDTRTKVNVQCSTSQKPHLNDNSSTLCYQNVTLRRIVPTPITITTALTVIEPAKSDLTLPVEVREEDE